MKKIYKNITDIDNGGLIEQANLDFSKIMASINDINTDKRKAAKLVIEIQVKAHEDDDFADVLYKVKATPLPIKPRKITLLNTSAQYQAQARSFRCYENSPARRPARSVSLETSMSRRKSCTEPAISKMEMRRKRNDQRSITVHC